MLTFLFYFFAVMLCLGVITLCVEVLAILAFKNEMATSAKIHLMGEIRTSLFGIFAWAVLLYLTY